jgi:anion-transporting  ArsA/GET3 family ATPase
VTIDPARRLADSLGLDQLGNTPRRVAPERLAKAGIELEGELWALMLDHKRTFDDLIERLAPDARARDEVLGNRIYQQLSNAVAGSQEFTAIAKLHELDEQGEFDLLVLDTPPSRNALDFLDAPARLTGFFQGGALKALLRPAGLGGRLLGRGADVAFGLLRRVTGVALLEDLGVFFRALGGMIDGFAERAERVAALLADPATTFLVVSAPAPEPLEVARFFHARLAEAGLPFGGMIVNRLHGAPGAWAPDDPAAGATLEATLGPGLASRVAAAAGAHAARAAAEREQLERARHDLGDPPMVLVAERDGDVHDLDGLLHVRRALWGD